MVFKVLNEIGLFCIGRKATHSEYIIFIVFICFIILTIKRIKKGYITSYDFFQGINMSDLTEQEKEELKEDAL